MNIKKIIVSFILIIILIGTILFIKNYDNKAQSDGTVIINVMDKTQNIVKTQKIEFFKEDTLKKIIEDNFNNVLFKYDGLFGYFILEIESIKTDFRSNYIKILVNNKYSEKGIDQIVLINEMVIDLIEEAVN